MDIVVKAKFFNDFRTNIIRVSEEFGYPASIGTIGTLKSIGKGEWRFYKNQIAIDHKWYQLDVRELSSNLKKDAEGRDFSCNALYIDIEQNCLLDFTNGIVALNNKRLLGCSDPATVFSDKARALRAFRFKHQYDFQIDQSLLDEMATLSVIPTDRIPAIITETKKILHHSQSIEILASLASARIAHLILQAFIKEHRYLNVFFFNSQVACLCNYLENYKQPSFCLIYGEMDMDLILEIMLGFFMLLSMPNGDHWHISDYVDQAKLIAKRMLGQNHPKATWYEKLILLMIVAIRDDPDIIDKDFHMFIVSQLPTPVINAMISTLNFTPRAKLMLESHAKAIAQKLNFLQQDSISSKSSK